ncbi:MAG: hypothetical protein D3917_18455 [Candidatus Electrothrix sp. AX5]|nr:hypothetical protein [Candidatus Electrothrix sp. AX5]
MRSAKKVRIQRTISYLIGRLITSCRFFSFIQKNLQAGYFGAESWSLITGQLLGFGVFLSIPRVVIFYPCPRYCCPVDWAEEQTPTIMKRVGHVGDRSTHPQPTSCLDLSNRQHTFYPIKGFPSYIQKGDLFTYKREVF